jgi:hypothetical protein
MPGSRPAWYLTQEYVGRDQTCDLQKLQVALFTVPLFLLSPRLAEADGCLVGEAGCQSEHSALPAGAWEPCRHLAR